MKKEYKDIGGMKSETTLRQVVVSPEFEDAKSPDYNGAR